MIDGGKLFDLIAKQEQIPSSGQYVNQSYIMHQFFGGENFYVDSTSITKESIEKKEIPVIFHNQPMTMHFLKEKDGTLVMRGQNITDGKTVGFQVKMLEGNIYLLTYTDLGAIVTKNSEYRPLLFAESIFYDGKDVPSILNGLEDLLTKSTYNEVAIDGAGIDHNKHVAEVLYSKQK